jgi:hypothetical protein
MQQSQHRSIQQAASYESARAQGEGGETGGVARQRGAVVDQPRWRDAQGAAKVLS